MLTIETNKYNIHYDLTMTMIKQWLFQDDQSSYFGLEYDLIECHLDNELNLGIFIPYEKVYQFLNVVSNLPLPFEKSHQFKGIFQILSKKLDEVKNGHITPTAYGNWRWERDSSVSQLKEYAIILHEGNKYTEVPITKEELPTVINQFFNEWLQYLIIQSPFNEKLLQPYTTLLKNKTSDEHVLAWLKALHNPSKKYVLPKHRYPHCLMAWHARYEEHFQFTLLIFEPSAQEEWRISLYLKEWETSHVCSIKDIKNGKHPFKQNPIHYIQNHQHKLKTSPVTEPLCMQEPEITVTNETISTFLLNDTENLEMAGISVLVPQKFQQAPLTPKLQGEIGDNILVENHSPSPWRGHSITWTYFIQDVPVNEETFRQWVEDKRQMIYVQDHWVLWDLKQAEKLLKYQEAYNSNHSSSFFDAYRQYIEQKEGLHVEDHSNEDSHIEWRIHPSNDLSHSNHSSDSLNSYWQQKLRDYQIEGVLWLINMRKRKFGACLADDMGLGKTIQTIAYCDTVTEEDQGDFAPHLIICPTSVLTNWANEFQKFAPWLHVYVHEGKFSTRRDSFYNEKRADVILTSYPLAVNDKELLQNVTWSTLILDEAQKLKNIQTKLRSTIGDFSAIHTVALTGTPVENDPKELWSLMDILNRGYLKTEDWFTTRFLSNKQTEEEEERFSDLRKLAGPFILRRTKEDFQEQLSLPDKKNKQYIVGLTDEQRSLYEVIVEDLLEDYHGLSQIEKRAKLFKSLTKLKQICNHPAQFLKEQTFSSLMRRSGKWDKCIRLLNNLVRQKKKVLIFTQYRQMGILLKEGIHKEFGIHTPFFHGALTTEKRQSLVEDFQTNDHKPFMIISLRAGGVGLNLTSATEVIHYDRWWNPAVENQATDRVYRIGQTNPVTVHTFITEGTLEEKIELLLSEKEAMTRNLLEQDSAPLWKLSKEELASLLTLRT
ncbi:DEAD/DEAH box helicase [Bacillus shivajii]|uniref:DEAD/DEAH box helicase n=1 Tax=Bacillus shivajii TaxID=1983719 RepID=UPI001CF9C4C7|nr:DEAD/DEAH box helicase [Bacillus shivajii]UCZ52008.1 DEAD/DEAH box helicase [Bacillus shivajii]